MNQYPPKKDEYAEGAPPPYNPNYGAQSTYNNYNAQPQQNVGFSNSGYNSDPEDPFNRPSTTFSDVAIRHAFIKKVYGILTLQLSVTIGFIALFIFVEAIQKFFQKNSWILWVIFALTIVIIIVLACCNNVARKYPLNIILLFAFTILESILVAIVAATYKLDEVLIAAGITAVVVVGITIFAFQTKIDFTGCGIYLFVGCLILLGFGLICGILAATGAFGYNQFNS
jgi:FtsH-binding integral membrane protein